MPPALRHNVVDWNLINIPKFSFERKSSSDFLGEKLHDNFNDNGFSIFKNALYEENKNMNEYNFIPYYIFDKTPRGLINIFYYLNKYDGIKQCYFSEKKAFIDTIISSTSDLAQYKDEIYSKYILWSDTEEKTIISFAAIYDSYLKENMEYRKKYIKQNKVKNEINIKYLRMFILLQITREILSSAEVIYNNNEDEAIQFYKIYGDNSSENTIEFSGDKNKIYKVKFYEEIRSDGYIKIKRSNNLNNLVDNSIYEILKYDDFIFSINLFENIKFNTEDDNVFITISKLIRKFSQIDYLKKWIENREKYYEVNKFLNEKILEVNEHRKIKELLFGYENESMVKNTALYNYIIKYGDIIKEKEYKFTNEPTIISNLKKYNKMRKENKKEDDLEVIEEKLRKDIFVFLEKELVNLNEILVKDNDEEIIKKYVTKAGKKGNRTLFNSAGRKANRLINSDGTIEDYIETYNFIKDLANNGRAWYGVYDSIQLLRYLNEGIYLNLSIDNEDLNKSIDDEVINKKKVNALIKELLIIRNSQSKYIELEEARQYIEQKTKEAYEKIIDSKNKFFNAAGYILEEMEEENYTQEEKEKIKEENDNEENHLEDEK